MAFLDDDEQEAAPGGPGSRRPGGDHQRQVMVRRVIALAVGALIVILLLLAVKGCLNARTQRGFENYASDLESIATQSNQLSADFFARLTNPPKGEDELTLEAQIASDRGNAEALLQRVNALDTPDELSDAQAELTQAFELRRDALADIATQIPNALGNDGRTEAIAQIAADMRAFLASDVLYARARASIETELTDQGVDSKVPESQFLPEPVERWLDDLQLTTVLSAFATNAGATSGVHGLAVLSTSINKTPLTADAENSVSLGTNAPELTVEVQNQGDQAESDVTVAYTLSGSAAPIEGQAEPIKLDAQGIRNVTIALDTTPDKGVPLTLEVEVLPVPGEQVVDNNKFTYTVTFD